MREIENMCYCILCHYRERNCKEIRFPNKDKRQFHFGENCLLGFWDGPNFLGMQLYKLNLSQQIFFNIFLKHERLSFKIILMFYIIKKDLSIIKLFIESNWLKMSSWNLFLGKTKITESCGIRGFIVYWSLLLKYLTDSTLHNFLSFFIINKHHVKFNRNKANNSTQKAEMNN